MTYPNPKAFPDSNVTSGMTLRDWFAGQALAGIRRSDVTSPEVRKGTAEWAYKTADAMLAARTAQ